MSDAAFSSRSRAELEQRLVERCRALEADVDAAMRDGRVERSNDVGDSIDECAAGLEGELSFALLQMRTETLARVAAALARLRAGTYGACSECGGEIAAQRLSALPFAVRCMRCEERHEQARSADRRVHVPWSRPETTD